MDVRGKPEFRKERGLQHFIAAGRYSWQGFLRLMQESAFRHELAAFVFGGAVLAALGAGVARLLVFAALMLVLFAVEAINTAIEELVDRISPEYSSVGKHAKDLGSFAVCCLIVVNMIYVAYVLVSLYLA